MKNDTDRSSQFTFREIYAEEKKEIITRREKHFDSQRRAADITNTDFVGLALSGGGIRSATFCLGFLQELHRLKILRIFDYLSTVSGGGYLGSWWSAWLSRDEVLVRAQEESPHFTVKDLKNVDSLVAKLRDSSDEVSSELKRQMRTTDAGKETLKLLELSEEDKPPAPKLVEGLVTELNVFIAQPPHKGAPILSWPESTSLKLETCSISDDDAKKEQSPSLKDLWTNRIYLEQTYPYELRNIFPPSEQIEPTRRYEKENGTGSEGSICAWEDPIHHLRLFANYLTPRKGMLSADTWRAVSVVIRNLLLTWLILLPILTAVMLLGQAYFLFASASQFTKDKPESISIFWALPPIGIGLAFIVALAIAWLLCNRDASSSTDLIAQVVCLGAVGTLLVSAFWLVPIQKEQWDLIKSYQPWLIGVGAVGLIIIVIMWHWGISRDDLSGKDRETVLSWRREVRRGRFSKVQAQLLVFTCIVAAVLLVSWISCNLFSSGKNPIISLGGGKYPTWLPVVPAILSALGGSIFTALRTAPSAGIDKPTSHGPSAASRFVFAATPGLVIFVLAVLAAWFAHWLLYAAVRMTFAPEREVRENLDVLLRAAGFLLITIFLALAIYEMKDIKWSSILTPTIPSLIFVVLLMVNVSWLWQALFATIFVTGGPIRWLLSAILASSVLIIIRRASPRGIRKWRLLYLHLKLVGIRLEDKRRANPRLARFCLMLLAPTVGVVVFTSLTLIGKAIGEVIFDYYSKQHNGKVLGALVLALAALAGGTVLYSLLTVREEELKNKPVFESRFFKNRDFSKRPEWLWALGSLSLVFPLIVLSLAHNLNPKAASLELLNQPILFPAALAVLLAFLILLRSLVLQRPCGATPLVGWTGKPFDWILGKIPRVSGRKAQAFRLLAFVALSVSVLGDILAKNFAKAQLASAFGSMGQALIRTEWILLGVALVVNLPIFGIAVFKLPPRDGFKRTFKQTSLLYRKTVLWILAFVCVSLAVLTGYLLTNWLEQLSKIELHVGLTPLLLPVAVGCLLMVVFEISWGQTENRRSLWLIGVAFLGITATFFMGLVASGEANLQTLGPLPRYAPYMVDSIRVILGLFAAVVVWIVSLGWMVDPNSVSMHQFYRDRLVRAYLGASNIRRRLLGNKEITDTVAGDDLPLKDLSNCKKGGPYHLINTTLNLVAGRDLATAQRSASSFILSQKYCGSSRTKYRITDEYMTGLLSLGTAVAASGAAVSPNMGSKKPTAALAMLMTLLNVRLGYWAPTPNQPSWNSSQPRLWPFYLIREFLSQTNDLSSYCYLTDGGHFDNTGLYPLIERGCRFIVLLDCGADPQPSCFQDLGEVIRRCRIDFGTEIDLDLNPLITRPGSDTNRSFVVGKIRFSEDHLSMLRKGNEGTSANISRDGIIVYFRPAVISDVTADVLQYSLENNFFPQQTTANQWFDEAQFESYRRLGMACANKAFEADVCGEISNAPRLTSKTIEAIFKGLESKFPSEVYH